MNGVNRNTKETSFWLIYILGLAKLPYIMVNYIKSIYFRKSVVKPSSVFLSHFRNLCFAITYNGTGQVADREELRLSAAYENLQGDEGDDAQHQRGA